MSNNYSIRIHSIDTLRGLAIGFMILSGAIAYHCGLPAWMFHCQVPPPDYVFNPAVRGITWVDIAFPFFIFSMGAAFPLAMRKRLENGTSNLEIIGSLLKRWITLVLFSLLIGNAERVGSSSAPDYMKGIFSILVWAGMFLCLLRTKNKKIARYGYLLILALMAAEWLYFKVPLSLYHTDIIIMILSSVALVGGFLWLFTRHSLGLRALVCLMVAAIKAVTSYTDALDFMVLPHWITWLFNWGFLQYLVIALAASMVGDMLLVSHSSRAPRNERYANGWAALVAIAAAAVQLWGLYTRNVAIDLYITVSLAVIFAALIRKNVNTNAKIGIIGFVMLLAGILFDWPDGGIAKDNCNLSYLFVTAGMASLLIYAFEHAGYKGSNGSFLARSGMNPMIAYTIAWFVIEPVLYACGLMPLIDGLTAGSMFWGVMRGVITVTLTYTFTGLFTRLEIFWRS